jgi:tetratricopeptide (TPR) repeat protein
LQLAPRDTTLLHNRKVFWTAYAEAALKAGKDREALVILRRAARLVPDGDFEAAQAELYCRLGEPLARAGKWEQALAVAERGLTKVDARPRASLRKWRADLFLRWSAAERKDGNFDKAAAVLEKGLGIEPGENDLARAVGYLARQWAKAAVAKGGAKEAAAVFQKLTRRFGRLPELKSAASGFVYDLMQKPLRDGKYEEALAALSRHDSLLTDKGEVKKLAAVVYDAWASANRKKNDWQGAADVYGKGLEKYPGDSHLVNNLVATYDAWAQTFMKVGDWAGAVAVYDKGLEQLPKDSHLLHNLNYCKKKLRK